jgi:hypothetical protein
VVTSTDPIIATPVSESTLALQTILIIMVWTMVPQPRMELLPNQQQAYLEEQQAQACAWLIDVGWVVAQHHDKHAGEQVALDAQMTELYRSKATLGIEQVTTINYTKA